MAEFEDLQEQPLHQSMSIELDWESYFEEFKAKHGQDPMQVEDRLLFPDGWAYGMSFEGPEYPPPTEKKTLLLLKLQYWRERHKRCKLALHQIKMYRSQLMEIQTTRSLPLRVVKQKENELGEIVKDSEIIDSKTFGLGRLQWLEEDLEVCVNNIEELTETLVEQGVDNV